MAAAAKTPARDLTGEVAFLTRALKAPTHARRRRPGWPSGPGPSRGRMRSS